MSKYGNAQTASNGLIFASIFESNCYQKLIAFIDAINGNQKDFRVTLSCHYPIELIPSKNKIQACYYYVDFCLHKFELSTGKVTNYFIEAKGQSTDTWLLKLKIINYLYPEIIENFFMIFANQGCQKRYVRYTFPKLLLQHFEISSLRSFLNIP